MTENSPTRVTGSCLCQAVRYEADALAGGASACHCVMCQKAHGGPIGAYVNLDGHRWTQGEELLTIYRSSEHCRRSFCSQCGSTFQFLDDRKPNQMSMAISSLDGDHGARLERHIFVETKTDWYDIPDDLPRDRSDS